MCCLIIKPKNKRMPSFDTLRACATANPDGFGFVSTKREYRSMDFYDFYRELRKVGQREKCVIHFRWATHGSVCKANCHPFKDAESRFYFAHNGVLSIPTADDMTDSETAFRDVVLPSIMKNGFGSSQMIKDTNEVRGCSRFAIYDRDNDAVLTLGQFDEYEGCFFSNMRFLPYKAKYTRLVV